MTSLDTRQGEVVSTNIRVREGRKSAVVQETLRILRAVHILPPRRSRMVTMAVPSTMELTNVLTLSCSTSSLWMTRGLLTTASYGRNGGAELPPPPRRYALSKPGYLPSSICHTMLSSTRTSPGRKRLWRVTNGQGSAHCRRAMDTVGAGVRSQLGEDAVAA